MSGAVLSPTVPALIVPVPIVLAHGDAPVRPGEVLGSWPDDPALVLLLVAGALLYALGVRRLWDGEAGRAALPRWRVRCAVGALGVTWLALLTPLEPVADTLVGVHMLQHLLLTLLVAPLLVLSRPILVTAMALPRTWRRRVWRVSAPTIATLRAAVAWSVVAAGAHVATVWVWHVPALYDAALAAPGIHALEHAMLVGGAVPFWWLVADARGRNATAASVAAVAVVVLGSGALAGLLSFAEAPWLADGTAAAYGWGLSAVEDQQLAGGLLWFPGALAYVVAGAVACMRWLRADEVASAVGQRH